MAPALLGESLALYRRLGDRCGAGGALGFLALVAYQRGDPTHAAARRREGLEAVRDLGFTWATVLGLGSRDWILKDRGRPTDAAQLLAPAQALLDATGGAVPRFLRAALGKAAFSGGGRGAREAAVVRLVARGRTDREVAAVLGITERTAASHVEHILQKLRLKSSVQIGVWATAHVLGPSV